MTSATCRVCKMSVQAIFSAVLLQKHPIQFFQCINCGYVQTEEPFWLPEAYENPINNSDTGIIMRNLWLRNIATTLIFYLFDTKGKFLDYGSGYGIFVRLMRDIGFDFFWHDLYSENLFARGFEFSQSKKFSVELLTCFEAFEHFEEPHIELEKLLTISRSILLSTEFVPDPTPPPSKWWYYGLEHGQHIGFFRKKTFEYLAKKHNLNFYTNGKNIHFLTDKQFLAAPIFKLITKVSKYATPLILKRMQSLTWKDSEKIKAISS